MQNKKISRALISVSDKSGIVELANELIKRDIEIISSDGTAALLRESGIQVRTVTEITGAPEILGGKVKTLHPVIHGALLADQDDPAQLAELKVLGPIDLLIINLYPTLGFDIGGPALTRAAAKNCVHVSVITNPNQYPELVASLDVGTSLEQRQKWAFAALLLTAEYDFALLKERGLELRYGENSQQSGALIAAHLDEVLQGKAMSYNNYLDLDAAWRVASFCQDSVAIVKHGIPSGISKSPEPLTALNAAWSCDPISAFGGVIATTHVVNEQFASALIKNFVEVVAAPDFTGEALKVFATKSNLRVVKLNPNSTSKTQLRSIRNGYLIQSADDLNNAGDDFNNWKLVSGSPVDSETQQELLFAWHAAAAARSNAIVIVGKSKGEEITAVGIGAGSVSRVDAAKLAIWRANQYSPGKLANSVAASDAFFPFPDGVQELAAAGVRAIVQPGGSLKDEAVIQAAQSAGITMYLTGVRHFSH